MGDEHKDARMYVDTINQLEKQGLLNNQRTTDGIFTAGLATAFFTSVTHCAVSDIQTQTVRIGCGSAEMTDVIRQNRSCLTCIEQVDRAIKLRRQLYEDAAKLDSSITIPETSSDIQRAITGLSPNDESSDDQYVFGVCRYACLECVIENASQRAQVRIAQDMGDCDTPNFELSFASSLQTQLQNEIDQQDNITNSIGKDSTSISMSISNLILSITSESWYKDVYRGLALSQNIEISPDSTSLYIDGLSQTLTFADTFSIVEHNYSEIRSSITGNSSESGEINTVDLSPSFNDMLNEIKLYAEDRGISIGIFLAAAVILLILALLNTFFLKVA